MSVVIKANGLSKQYQIGATESYGALRDTLASAAKTALRRLQSPLTSTSAPSSNTFWALSDVSFEVEQGQIVGLIGRNGSGKSTLLKILSRITEPTLGEAFIRGRVGSLLEVGTGFHPELTGRENVFVNGAILGMKRAVRFTPADAITLAESLRADGEVGHTTSANVRSMRQK